MSGNHLYVDPAGRISVNCHGQLAPIVIGCLRDHALPAATSLDMTVVIPIHLAVCQSIHKLALLGEATLTIGANVRRVGPPTWVHLPAHQPHSLEAHTPVVMLLILLRGGSWAG